MLLERLRYLYYFFFVCSLAFDNICTVVILLLFLIDYYYIFLSARYEIRNVYRVTARSFFF